MATDQTYIPAREYSREEFTKLFEVVNGRNFLADETLGKIDEALQNGDDGFLRGIYEILLDLFDKNAQINSIFEERQKMLMDGFVETITVMKKDADKKARELVKAEEAREKAEAEKILEQL